MAREEWEERDRERREYDEDRIDLAKKIYCCHSCPRVCTDEDEIARHVSQAHPDARAGWIEGEYEDINPYDHWDNAKL